MSPTDPKAGKSPFDSQADQNSLPVFDLPSEGEIDLGALRASDDDVVNFADLPDPPSGQSLTSWTAIIRQQALAQADGPDALKVDAPSDRDLLSRMDGPAKPPKAPKGPKGPKAPKAPAAEPAETAEIPEAQLPVLAPRALPTGRSESDIDLGTGQIGGVRSGESEIRFDIMYPPSDAAGAMPAPGAAPLSSVDFRTAVPAATPADDDLPFAARPAGEAEVDLSGGDDDEESGGTGRSSILDVLLRETGATSGPASADVLDFGEAPPVRPARPTFPTVGRPGVPTQPGIDMAGRAEEGGGDLVGSNPEMASDESIDLLAEPSASPNITDSGTLEISEEAIEVSQRRTEAIESSSVDLNTRPNHPGSEFDVALDAVTDDEADSGVDLSLPEGADPGGSSMVHADAAVDAATLVKEFEARRKTRKQTKAEATELPPTRAVKSSPRVVFPGRREAPRRSARPLAYGAALGLLLGAGGVLAAYFGGALPDRRDRGPVVLDNSFQLLKLKEDLDASRREAGLAKTDVDRKVAAATGPLDARINNLSQEVQRAQAQAAASKRAADDAVKARQGAERAAADATTQLTQATQARTAAETNLAAAKKEAADAQKAAGEVRAAAEAREKEAAARLAEATKKVADLTALADATKKSADDARKAADEAARARDASDATLQAISDRLARAKLVPEKADATALLRGIDDALKASAGDAAQALRDELIGLRQQEARAKSDLTAAREKEAEATRVAAAVRAEAQKLATELTRAKAENDRLTREATAAAARVGTADSSAAELARLKVENDRLARDLEAVKELAELIKTPAPAVADAGPPVRPDPARLAEQFFGDGLRAFHGGRHTDAESSFRKAIQFRPADARFHYLLGLTLWARNDAAGAEAEFEKGRDLEMQSRPSSRVVGAALERIQGSARQAVDAYRP